MSVDVGRRSLRNSKRVIYAESEDSDGGSDYEELVSKKRQLKRSKKNSKASKRNLTIEDLGEDFKENALYTFLCNPKALITELVLEWISKYEFNESEAVCELINLVLRSCGCIYLFQPHDLANLESANDTVAELIIAFKRQNTHEYPFVSNNKDLKFFRGNVIKFFTTLTELCHQRELLYVDPETVLPEESLSSPLISQIFTWLLALSSASARPLRLVSTTIIMEIQTQLSLIILQVWESLEKVKTQLTNTKKKVVRNQKSKIEIAQQTVNQLTHQKDTLMEYLQEIVNDCFLNRYNDVDPLIRQQCIKELSNWMINYDYFLENGYSQYFGYLLLDPDQHTRSQVLGCLLKVYKYINQQDIHSLEFRKLTEEVTQQVILMSYKDIECGVRINAVNVLGELIKLEVLDYHQQIELCGIYLSMMHGSEFSKINHEKLVYEYSKFVSIVAMEKTKHLGSITSDDKPELVEFVKVKALVDIFNEVGMDDTTPCSLLYSHLYQLTYYKNWMSLVDCILQTNSDNVMNQLSNKEKAIILSFLYGALIHIVNKKKWENPNDDRTKVTHYLLDKFEALLIQSQRAGTVEIFIKLWILILTDYNKITNIYELFQNANLLNILNNVNIAVFDHFKDCSDIVLYEEYFNAYFNSTTTTEITNAINDVLYELSSQCSEKLNAYLHQEPLEGLSQSSPYICKLSCLGNFVDITKYIEESDTESLPITDLVFKIVKNTDYTMLDSTQFTKYHINQCFNDVFDLLMTLYSLKLERLVNVINQQDYDIQESFANCPTVIELIWEIVNEVETLITKLNSQLSTSLIATNDAKQSIEELNSLKTTLITKSIDMLLSLRVFRDKFVENTFKNFQEYFEKFTLIHHLPLDMQHNLLNLYITKESALARASNLELNRSGNEMVEYSHDLAESTSIFDSDNEDEDADNKTINKIQLENVKAKQIWELEKQLCVYSVKLYQLYDVGIIDQFVISRMELNSKTIGGLFAKLVSQRISN